MHWLYLWIATQIITESFPVSSSSHVRLLCFGTMPGHADELLHLPTLIIYAIFFRGRWLPALIHLPRTWRVVLPLVLRVAISCAITVFFYLLFAYTHWNELFPMSAGLLVTAGLLLSRSFPSTRYAPSGRTEKTVRGECFAKQNVSNHIERAVFLGLAQSLALLPGISRMAITYVTGRWLGMSPQHSFEYSCAIQVPLIIASLIRGLFEPLPTELLNPVTGLVILISSIIAYGGLCITWRLAERNKFYLFGYYVLALAVITLL